MAISRGPAIRPLLGPWTEEKTDTDVAGGRRSLWDGASSGTPYCCREPCVEAKAWEGAERGSLNCNDDDCGEFEDPTELPQLIPTTTRGGWKIIPRGALFSIYNNLTWHKLIETGQTYLASQSICTDFQAWRSKSRALWLSLQCTEKNHHMWLGRPFTQQIFLLGQFYFLQLAVVQNPRFLQSTEWLTLCDVQHVLRLFPFKPSKPRYFFFKLVLLLVHKCSFECNFLSSPKRNRLHKFWTCSTNLISRMP